MKDLIKQILVQVGEDPSREGLQNTPERVEKSLKFLTSGYAVNIDELVNGA
ncbi:MAG: GTP cyclohydrolase I, partial [Nitrospinaceae bacterium]